MCSKWHICCTVRNEKQESCTNNTEQIALPMRCSEINIGHIDGNLVLHILMIFYFFLEEIMLFFVLAPAGEF